MKKFTVLLSLLLMFTLMLTACQSGATTAAPAATTAAAGAETTAAPQADAEIKIMFIPKNQGNPYFEAIVKGFEEAAGELGITFETTGPATAEATSQIEYVEAAVQNGFNVIFIAANSNDALNPTFDAAREAGVKIVIINQDIPGSEEHRDAAILPTDFTIVGASQVECLGQVIDYKGKIAILSATTDAPDQNFWIEGMKKTLAEDSKYAGMELVEVVYGDDQPEKSTTEMEALMTKYPDLRGVISPTTVGVSAAAKVVQTKKKGESIAVIGLGLPSQMKEFIKDGTIKQFQLWNPVHQGYLAAYLGVALANGDVEAKEGASFEAGKLGEFNMGKDAVIITGPPFTFDASNIDEFSF
jgi:rhamnose transport system substrate-binding protein